MKHQLLSTCSSLDNLTWTFIGFAESINSLPAIIQAPRFKKYQVCHIERSRLNLYIYLCLCGIALDISKELVQFPVWLSSFRPKMLSIIRMVIHSVSFIVNITLIVEPFKHRMSQLCRLLDTQNNKSICPPMWVGHNKAAFEYWSTVWKTWSMSNSTLVCFRLFRLIHRLTLCLYIESFVVRTVTLL